MGLFTPTLAFSPSIRMGNTALLGHSRRGMEAVMEKTVADAINQGYAVLVFRDLNNAYSAATAAGGTRRIFAINSSNYMRSESLDIYAGLSDRDYARRMLDSFHRFRPIESSIRMQFESYVALIVRICRLLRTRVKMNEFINYDIDIVEKMHNDLVRRGLITNPSEVRQNDRLIKSIQVNAATVQAYFQEFANNRVGEVLSGADSLETVLDKNGVLEISLDFSNNEEDSVILMDAIIDRICDLRYSSMIKKQLCVITDMVPNKHMQDAGLNRVLNLYPRCMMVYSVMDVDSLVQGDSSWMTLSDTKLCFRQTAVNNMQHCSNLFGTVTRFKPSFSWFGRFGFGLVPVQEPKYKPEVFSKLPDNMAIYGSTSTAKDGHVRIY